MIVGRGMLARAFAPRFGMDAGVVVFASGVSNSAETDAGAFRKEREMLQQTQAAATGRVVYFGSCGVIGDGEPRTPYMDHKAGMEALVLAHPAGLVLRLPQVVGRTENPHTLTNFLHHSIVFGTPFEVWSDAERNLIDVDDIVSIGSAMILATTLPSRVQSIAARESTRMPELVGIFEKVLGCRANCTFRKRGAALHIESDEAQRLADGLGLDLGPGYAERVIGKYYGRHAST